MYAIFRSGGKQYRAEKGIVVKLEKLPGAIGDKVVLDEVMMVSDGESTSIGQPLLDDTVVSGRIVDQRRGPKIVIFKHKRRKDYRKKQGHRQSFTAVLVEDIGQQGAIAPTEAVEVQTVEVQE